MATLARWCYRHRLVVLLLWVGTVFGVGFAGSAAGTDYANVFSLPDTDSKRAYDLMDRAFPERAGDVDTVVWKVDNGSVGDASVRSRIEPALERIGRMNGVGEVTGRERRAATTVTVLVDEPGDHGPGEVPGGRSRRGAPAGSGDPRTARPHPPGLDGARGEDDAVGGEDHGQPVRPLEPEREPEPAAADASAGAASGSNATDSSPSASRPGVRRFHLRMTKRNTT